MTLGERIKLQREEHRMTLEEVAKYVGVSRQTVFKYENGIITNIPSDKIAAMARLFNISPAYIMGWTDDPSDSAGMHRTPIVVPNNELFNKVVKFMSPDDYVTVMTIFEKTYNKMKEQGEIE